MAFNSPTAIIPQNDSPLGVHFTVEKNMGIITLDRPKALNSLSIEMMAALRQQLLSWRGDPNVQAVLVQSSTPGIFCAGGDLKRVHRAQTQKDFTLLEYMFRQEYALTYLIASFPKPYIALSDGIIMGGGMGLAAHAQFHIMGDHIRAAMPETNIGYFPDVGATAFLKKAPGKLGLFLGLTGNHIATGDALYARWGTHYVPSQFHKNLAQDLINLSHKTKECIQNLLLSFQKTSPEAPLRAQQATVDRLFSGENVLEIYENCNRDPAHFAQHTAHTLALRSPTSLAVTHSQLTQGPQSTNMYDIMAFEFALSCTLTPTHDFQEGIRAAIIDKDKKPIWAPNSIESIDYDLIQNLLQPLKTEVEPFQVDTL